MKKNFFTSIKLVFAVLFFLILLGIPVQAFAQFIPLNFKDPSNLDISRQEKTQEIEKSVDRFFADEMAENHVPGAVFTLVKDGKIILSKGYGYADLEQKIPAIPDQTLFRVGSISKLFTATAVMQLAEQGKLSLNDDINQYLQRFQVGTHHDKPITFAHLLTHTDGFDVAWTIGSATNCQSEIPSLEQLLVKDLPPRVLPPGEEYLYGDVGMALAGYLVETISGIPFTQYIEQNILQPLDMNHSSFQQPLPSELATNLAVGYGYKNDTYIERPFTCFKSIPTAALSATAADMAHFMITHLQEGRYGATSILNKISTEEMHRQHFTNFPQNPRAAGTAYGFYERFENNQRMIEHGGSMSGYSSILSLIPEQNLGFFVAYNNNRLNENIGEDLLHLVLDRYFPRQEEITNLQAIANSAQLSQQISGYYRYTRYPHYSIVKLATFLLESNRLLRVKNNGNGTLTLSPNNTQWIEVEPLTFRYPDSNIYIGFQQDRHDKITGLSFSDHVFANYEKLKWYETPTVQLGMVSFCVLVFLTYLTRLIKPLIVKKGKPTVRVSRITHLAQLSVHAIALLNLIFLIGLLLAVFQIDFWQFSLGIPPVVIALFYLPIFATGLTTGLPIVTLLAWRDKAWSVFGRSHYLLTGLAAGVFIFFLNYWNLLGFRF